MFVLIKRIFKAGFSSFKRHQHLSFATILILVMTVSLVALLFVSHKVLKFTIFQIRSKADISVYFQKGAAETEIFELKQKLAEFSEVKEIEYVSEEAALENFIARHQNEKALMESLAEVGDNPFLASLNIKAFEAQDYEKVVNFLEDDSFSNLINKIDYFKRKSAIEKVFSATSFLDKAGVSVSLALIAISVLVTFNTIRLAIYTQKEEITIAKLVGASNWFVRGPFLVQGVLCGLSAFIFSFVIITFCFYFFSPKITVFFPGFKLFDFFRQEMGSILAIQIIGALILGIIPSFFAIRKYLRV